jgi:hypothetical protein
MLYINRYCPITSTVFYKLSDHFQKSFTVIKLEDTFLQRQVKHVGIYAKKTAVALAYLVAALATPVLLAVDGGAYLLRKGGIHLFRPYFDDFHYLYTSKIFDSHLTQLQSFVKDRISNNDAIGYNGQALQQRETFEGKTLALIHAILNPPHLNSEKSKRAFHQSILEQLRELVKEKQAQKNTTSLQTEALINFIEELCEWTYTGPKLMADMIDFVESHLTDAEIEQLWNAQPEELPKLIEQIYERLGKHPKFNGIDETPRLYDPRHLGDLPSVLYRYPLKSQDGKASKEMKMIRTPNVTRDTRRDGKDLKEVAVVEEFLGFLDSYQKKGKVHVYINLMFRNPKGSEGVRCKAIEELEQHYPNTLHVITLTKDTYFYKQTKMFENLNNAVDFKKTFISEMFDKADKDSDYHWSPALGTRWREECEQILEKVHAAYFQNRVELTREERLDFIELAYTEIIEAILNKLQPDSANDACKSCIDRGAAALAAQYLKRHQSELKAMSPRKRKKFVAITLAPALLAMNRVMQDDKMQRFLTLTPHLFSAAAAV